MMRTAETDAFVEALLACDRRRAFDLAAQGARERGESHFIDQTIVTSLEEIGRRWERSKVALSQIYMSSRICEQITDTMLPQAGVIREHNAALGIATLEDHHLLGKKIVTSALRASGYDVLDLGFGMGPETLINSCRKHDIQVLIISVLMYPSALKVQQVADVMRAERPDFRVLVGGAPFRLDPELWQTVHADAMAVTPGDTVKRVSAWLAEEVHHA